MRKTNRIIAFVVCLILIISVSKVKILASEGDNGVEKLKALYKEQQTEKQVVSEQEELQAKLNSEYEKIEKIMSGNKNLNEIKRSDDNYDKQDRVYNDQYSGSYISGDKLIVCITDECVKEYYESELVEYQIVKKSYNELKRIKASLTDSYERLFDKYRCTTGKEKDLLENIVGFEISEKSNSVVVLIKDDSEEKEGIFASLFEVNEGISYCNTGSKVTEAVSCKPGQGIKVLRLNENNDLVFIRGSIGYRAYKTAMSGATKYGFVTCAHGIKDSVDGYVYTTSYSLLGRIDYWQYEGSADASFVELMNGNTFTMMTMYSDQYGSTTGGTFIESNSYVSYAAAGSTVHKVGSTTYKTSGEIESTSFDCTDHGITFTNLTRASFDVAKGDSGGIVYIYSGGGYKPIGIASAEVTLEILWFTIEESLYTKASEIAYCMGVVPY